MGGWELPLWDLKERGGGKGVVRRIDDTCSCGVRPTRGGGGREARGWRKEAKELEDEDEEE